MPHAVTQEGVGYPHNQSIRIVPVIRPGSKDSPTATLERCTFASLDAQSKIITFFIVFAQAQDKSNQLALASVRMYAEVTYFASLLMLETATLATSSLNSSE